MSDYLTDYKPRNSNVKVELDLKNYTAKEELKNITHVDTSIFALKTNLASLKTKVVKNETDNDNLETKVTTTETNIKTLKTKVDGIDLTKYVLKSSCYVLMLSMF